VSPKKKASALPASGSSTPEMPASSKVLCPACKSEISADGSTLHAKSKWLEDLIEEAGTVEKVESLLAEMEKKYTAVKQENERLKADVVAKTKTGGKENETVAGAEQSKRGNWW
jgi:hypothetical protein